MKKGLRFLLFPAISLSCITAHAQNCAVSIAPDNCTGSTLQAITSNVQKVDTLTWYNGATPVQVSVHKTLSKNVDTVTSQNVFALIGYDDVTIDKNGNVYTVASTCVVYEWVKSTNQWITPAGNNNCAGSNKLVNPTGVAVDAFGNIYVAEAGAHRVTKWTNGVRTVVASNLGTPYKLSIDKNNNLYILDQGKEAVYQLPYGAVNYTLVAGGNGTGSALNQFNMPTCIDVDADGNVYVGDPNNNRVVKWAPGSAQGIIAAGGGANVGSIYDIHPLSLHVDAFKNLFILDGIDLIYWPARSSFGINIGKVDPNDYDASVGYPIYIDSQYRVYEGSSGYLVNFSPTNNIDTTHFAPAQVYATYRVASRYNSGCKAVSDTIHLVAEPYQPVVFGQSGGTCGLTLPYANYYFDDPTHPTLAWTVPQYTNLLSGQGTDSILLQFTDTFKTGLLKFTTTNACKSYTYTLGLSAAPTPGTVTGRRKVPANTTNVLYYVTGYEYNSTYNWTVPRGATIVSGQGTDSIRVNFGTQSGKMSAVTTNACGSTENYSIRITITNSPGAEDASSAIASAINDGSINLYPQPANNVATLQFNADRNDMCNVRVVDLSGKVVLSIKEPVRPGVNTISLNISSLASGVYMVAVYKPGEKPGVVKLIKN